MDGNKMSKRRASVTLEPTIKFNRRDDVKLYNNSVDPCVGKCNHLQVIMEKGVIKEPICPISMEPIDKKSAVYMREKLSNDAVTQHVFDADSLRNWIYSNNYNDTITGPVTRSILCYFST